MTGCNSGLIAHVCRVVPNVKLTHFILHKESLASKALQPNLGAVFNSVVKVLNLIKKRPLQTRLLREFCKMGADHEHLLFHWGGSGRGCGNREVLAYLEKEDSDLADLFCDKLWLARLAYLVDIFRKLSELNTSLQGKESTIVETDSMLSMTSGLH
ncbi:unnamed protein product, partial [Coregonus sp. 'balchen']